MATLKESRTYFRDELLGTTCRTCARLAAEVNRLQKSYAIALAVLLADSVDPDADAYSHMKVRVDDAWIDYQIARAELAQHKTVHAPGRG